MEISHSHILKLLGDYWETYAIKLNPFETLCVIDWAYNYNKQLRQFAIRDDSLYNGFLTLCNTYASKIHGTLIPLILNILKSEASDNCEIDEDHKGYVFTTAPYDLVKLFNEAFQVVRVKKIKDLMLKMLKVY